MSNDIILSQDGSHTIHSQKFGVSYHSKYGAIQETQTVFINPGLQYQIDRGRTHLNILEMGFGTGLNALMTLNHEPSNQIFINYHTIEAYPIIMDQVRQLNYPDLLDLTKNEREQFYKMHASTSCSTIELRKNFHFTKHISLIEDFESNVMYDVIYYDAFAPSTQEHLWTEQMMQKLSNITVTDGVLNTYCAKGVFKRALKAAGFVVEGLPGPIGKREITRGIKL